MMYYYCAKFHAFIIKGTIVTQICSTKLGILFWHEGKVVVLDTCSQNHAEIANVFGYLFILDA